MLRGQSPLPQGAMSTLWERVLPAKATLRSGKYNAPNSSRAEPAPTRSDVDPVGAGSTREGHAAVWQVQRAEFFAGRARSHKERCRPCGSGFYPRMPRCVLVSTTRRILRGQSPLPQGAMSTLWERVLPANATLRSGKYNAPNSSRAEPAPTRSDVDPVGAGSTREGHAAVWQVQRAEFFAGRARSHSCLAEQAPRPTPLARAACLRDQWNCSSSVEPVRAVTDEAPPWITVVMSSK